MTIEEYMKEVQFKPGEKVVISREPSNDPQSTSDDEVRTGIVTGVSMETQKITTDRSIVTERITIQIESRVKDTTPCIVL